MAEGFANRWDVSRMLARLAVVKARWSGSTLQRIGDFGQAQVLTDSTQSFRRQADPTTGKPWQVSKRADDAFWAARLAHSTGRRRTEPRRTTTLVKTGRMRRSVRSGYILGATGKLVVWGGIEPLVYGAIHQFGGQAGRHHATTIPARPYVGLSPERSEQLRTFARKAFVEDAQ
jgi:phage virion morphogenesis protein